MCAGVSVQPSYIETIEDIVSFPLLIAILKAIDLVYKLIYLVFLEL